MQLLFFTRKIDKRDERAGFVSDWVLQFAKNSDKLFVVCQEKGDINSLPDNVKIYSLGKEKGYSKLRQFVRCQVLSVRCMRRVDGVFSHMIPHYAVIAGPWCKIFRKKLIQWYTHGTVSFWLKLANFFVDEFVTASPESFRMKTKKPVHIFGHGINVGRFAPSKIQDTRYNFQFRGRGTNNQFPISKFIILSVSRISPSKNIDVLIKAIEQVQLNEPELRDKILLQIIGGPGLLSQASYYNNLIEQVREKKIDRIIDFIGPLPQKEVLGYYQNCDLFINLSETGSIDKAVLEAMACGKLVLTSNEAFKKILDEQFLCSTNLDEIIEKIKSIYQMSELEKIKWGNKLRKIVEEKHNLEVLVKKITNLFRI